MNIGVVDLVSKDGGSFTITKSFFDYVAHGNAMQHNWFFILGNQGFEESDYVKIIRFKDSSKNYLIRVYTELFKVNKAIRRFDLDCIICMSNMRIIGCRIPQYVYLHQSIPFQKNKHFSFFKKDERSLAARQYLQGFIIEHSISNAASVFVQTEWMQNAVSNKISKNNVVNIGYPFNSNYEYSNKIEGVSTDFFYPCGPWIYKNISTIVEAVELLRSYGYHFKFYLTLSKDELRRLGNFRNEDDIDCFECLGKISHKECLEMYCKTTLVFASYLETLGLPLVEAKECGTWIIASDCDFSHEVLDLYPNKAYFNPFDVSQLVNRMKCVLDGKASLNSHYNYSEAVSSNCWNTMVLCIENQSLENSSVF